MNCPLGYEKDTEPVRTRKGAAGRLCVYLLKKEEKGTRYLMELDRNPDMTSLPIPVIAGPAGFRNQIHTQVYCT